MAKAQGSRRISRSLLVQALYAWRLANHDGRTLLILCQSDALYKKANQSFLTDYLFDILDKADAIRTAFVDLLDRPLSQISPVELAIMMLAAYELIYRIDVPTPVILNEAIELAKDYGGTDGHKYINGVIDRLAKQVRSADQPPAALPTFLKHTTPPASDQSNHDETTDNLSKEKT